MCVSTPFFRTILAASALALATPQNSYAQKAETGPFATPLRVFSAVEQTKFNAGFALFRDAWVVEKVGWISNPLVASTDTGLPGIGPLYNQNACSACHVGNARGAAPAEGEAIRLMVVRLSVDGTSEHGGPRPHPVYGGQLNPQGIAGVPGEGDAVLHYETRPVTLAGGESVELRAPKIAFRGLNYGPIAPDTKISVRNAPPVAGLGLLAQVPENALRDIAKQNGGKLNHVWDLETGKTVLGRFGWKANQPSIAQQMANAFSEDMGVNSRLFPRENCTGAQTACLIKTAESVFTELPEREFESVVFYLANLAPPPRREADTLQARAGAKVFAQLGCGQCHREKLPLANGGAIAPYTDLALHDMGGGLADGRPDYEAGPRDWRTPPLWGLGSASENAQFLHDGRARSFAEAILWHGGQAEHAAKAYQALPKPQRDDLGAFLNSL
jgi:CxxC motif-containing protein (DUF1111 family)